MVPKTAKNLHDNDFNFFEKVHFLKPFLRHYCIAVQLAELVVGCVHYGGDDVKSFKD